MPDQSEFIILPRSGLSQPSATEKNALRSLPVASSMAAGMEAFIDSADQAPVEVIDSVREDGPKLVRLTAEAAAAVNSQNSILRAVPLVSYDRPRPHAIPQLLPDRAGPASPAAGSVTIRCLDSSTGQPIPGCDVIAFTDFANRFGDQAQSDASGEAHLSISSATIERLYIYSPDMFWGAYRKGMTVAGGGTIDIDIEPIDLTYTDAVRYYFGSSKFDPSTGVTVGVIDSGIGNHLDLNVLGSINTVTGEPITQTDDPSGHGTHVAGLIGSNGSPPAGLRGVAPGVNLRGYRVFPPHGGATNYAILKAMIYAAGDGCDIINLSLGGGPFDDIVEEAIADARNNGMLVIIAAGNDDRGPVNYPAAHQHAIAVSAMGRSGTFPPGSLPEGDVETNPVGNDPAEFVASFSNVGHEIELTGCGVGVLSTMPGNGFAQMGGTSMAAPVVVGAAACLLSMDPALYGMTRNAARSDAMAKLLRMSCVQRGFGHGGRYEGYGLPTA